RIQREESELTACRERKRQLVYQISSSTESLEELPPYVKGDLAKKTEAIDNAKTSNHYIKKAKKDLANALEQLALAPEGILQDEKLEAAVKRATEGAAVTTEASFKAGNEVDASRARKRKLAKALRDGTCSACGQSISSPEQIETHERELAREEELYTQLEMELNKAEVADRAAATTLQACKAALKMEFCDWGWKSADWTTQKADCENYLTSGAELVSDEDLEAMQLELTQIAEAKGKRVALEEIIEISAKKAASAHELEEELMDEIAQLKEDCPTAVPEELMTEWRESVKQLHEDRHNATEHISKCGLQIVSLTNEVNDLKSALEKEIEFKESNSELKLLKELVTYLKDSRIKFLATVWNNILGSASGFLSQATDKQITALSRSDKDGFMFCEEGVYAPVSAASGAQRGFIGVSIRLALAQSLRSSCDLVVLDEPTESMSEENALRLSGTLLSQGQIITITHRLSDSYTASNIIQL
ncbi:MAG: hypothetical protein DRR06_20370, partial [Gammaproteobacteria bacterium]